MKVRVLAVGISNYPTSILGGLLSAAHDARSIFNVVGEVFEPDFSSESSHCFSDITAAQFRVIIELFLRDAGADDLAILFFSGHGSLDNDELVIHFSDSIASGGGQLSVSELAAILKRARHSEKLLILDCCHAGAAATLALSNSAYFGTKVSVLASNGIMDRAHESETNGHFTAALVDCIRAQSNAGVDLKLSEIATQVRVHSPNVKPVLAIHPEIDDLILPSRNKMREDPRIYAEAFYRALDTSNSAERAVMWYALCSEPENIRLAVLGENVTQNMREVSWLGRRSIGSCIDSIVGLKKAKVDLVVRLLESHDWAENCVGAIGGRGELALERLRLLYSRLARAHGNMDAAWLALLYLGDAGFLSFVDLVELLDSGFGQSNWGRYELLKQCTALFPMQLEEFRSILSSKFGDEVVSVLFDILLLGNGSVEHPSVSPNGVRNTALKDIHSFAALKRSRTNRQGISKWFFSKLHGNWREHVQTDFAPLFDRLNDSQFRVFLGDLSALPAVATKLGVFDALQRRVERSAGNLQYWEWGLRDEHPWVVREAWRLLISVAEARGEPKLVDNAISRLPKINSDIYPGRLESRVPLIGWLLRNEDGFGRVEGLLGELEFSWSERKMLSSFFDREFRFLGRSVLQTD